MHETNEQYLKFAKLGDGRAEYNPDNTTIHINLSKPQRLQYHTKYFTQF